MEIKNTMHQGNCGEGARWGKCRRLGAEENKGVTGLRFTNSVCDQKLKGNTLAVEKAPWLIKD